MRHLGWFVAVIVLAGASPAHADAKQISYAIVIGNNTPPLTGTSEHLQPLRYADDDAVRYYQLFSHVAEAHLLAVLDAQTQKRYPSMAEISHPPTLANLRAVVDELAAKMTRDRERGDRPVLYFAFSGHGARDDHGEPFLALLDGALTQHVLYEEVLGRMPATFAHVIVDACHAGGVVGVRGGFFDREANTKSAPTTVAEIEPILEATPLARYPQVGVILATTVDEETHEWSAVESGVFTHELLSGLTGAADVNGDLVIEYSELQAFVASANRDIKDPRAVPHVIARPPATNQRVALFSLHHLAGMRLVRGDASGLGHFYVELSNGQRYLDAHVERGGSFAFALPDATAAFLRTETREAPLPARGAVALSQLALADRAVEGRGSVEVAYQTSLFASEFGRSYYQGYIDSIGALGVSFPEAVDASTLPSDRTGRGRLALGSALVGGVAAAVSITTGVLAYQARRDFEATNLQRAAHDAQARYARYLPISFATGGAALVAGVAAWWLWPRSRVTVVPSAGEGGYGVSVGARW
jgi:hypothetical protein